LGVFLDGDREPQCRILGEMVETAKMPLLVWRQWAVRVFAKKFVFLGAEQFDFGHS